MNPTTPTTPNYNVDYFIAKFTAIPEERWITGQYTDDEERHCAYGHCKADTEYREEADALFAVMHKLFGYKTNIPSINDGKHPDYQQSTPRQRILAALEDVKKLEQLTKVNDNSPTST